MTYVKQQRHCLELFQRHQALIARLLGKLQNAEASLQAKTCHLWLAAKWHMQYTHLGVCHDKSFHPTPLTSLKFKPYNTPGPFLLNLVDLTLNPPPLPSNSDALVKSMEEQSMNIKSQISGGLALRAVLTLSCPFPWDPLHAAPYYWVGVRLRCTGLFHCSSCPVATVPSSSLPEPVMGGNNACTLPIHRIYQQQFQTSQESTTFAMVSSDTASSGIQLSVVRLHLVCGYKRTYHSVRPLFSTWWRIQQVRERRRGGALTQWWIYQQP